MATMSSPKLPQSTAPLLVFGAGGHGRVVADAALLEKRWSGILASARDLPLGHAELLPGIRLLNVEDALRLNPLVHIAIGNNLAREKEAGWWGHERLASVVHPAAMVSRFSSVAPGCFAAAGVVIGPAATVGPCVIVNHGAIVDHDVDVGAFSHIAPNVTLGGHVKVGRRVLVGAGATVLPSMIIGDDITVGAGAVVSEHLIEPGVYAGIPARRVL